MSDPTRTPTPRTDAICVNIAELNAGVVTLTHHAEQLERELQAATDRAESAERDAGRYRWLRGCSPYSSAHGAVSVNWPIFDNGKLMWSENAICAEALDAAIDAAMPKPASTTPRPERTRTAGIPVSADE